MFEIDDAGGGCFLGPEILVIHRLDPDRAWYITIPPQVRERVNYATKQLKRVFKELAVSKEETVCLCRGEIFDPFQMELQERGFQVVREKVSTATDCLAEAKFMEILYSYGFPCNLALKDRNYQRFYELVACWYFSQGKQKISNILKVRSQPPFRVRKMGQRYPNLVRLMLEESATG